MRSSFLFIAMATLAAQFGCVQSGSAQTTADYVKLRNAEHIVQPTPGEKLDGITGFSVVEVQVLVQGVMHSGSSTQLLAKRDDGDTFVIQCPSAPPEWLGNGEVPARVLMRVYRGQKMDSLDASLLSVAKEDDIAKIDAAYWKAEAAKAKAQKESVPARASYPAASRGGGDPNMYGWIGRGHREVAYTSSDSILAAYRNFVLSRNKRLGFAQANKIAQSVISYSNYYRVDARLVMAVILCESDFRPMSTSHSGAMGLGQLMPGTASWMGVSNPYDLRENLYGMIKLLRTHMDEYHVDSYPVGSPGYFDALCKVLGAYNAGDGAVRRYGGVPPYQETQNYVKKVVEYFQRLCS